MSGKPSSKKNRKRRAPSGPGKPPEPRPGAPSALNEPDEQAGELLIADWQASRSGARAGRGFHFQDAVGAWLAARVAAGHVNATAVTPEGVEDIVLEGSQPAHIQVKSRVAHLGGFSPRLATRHIVDAWNRHASRSTGGRLVVVLERGVDGEEGLASFTQCLADSLTSDSELRRALTVFAGEEGMSDATVGEMIGGTVVLGTSWQMLAEGTAASVSAVAGLAPSALKLVARQLRLLVAEASDANAALTYDRRRVLTKAELVAQISRVASHIDLDALELALREGICDAFDLSEAAGGDDRFYEGTATQPFHVAAGLVVPRPDVVAEVLAGLGDQSAVVITGPSGVGKSAVLWTVPLAAPGVLWFRVRRLSPDDVPAIVRLARAYNASESAPVGFLVDGAGVGDIQGWARLRAEAAAVLGFLLVGTARTEDLPTLGDLAGCATVRVALNDVAAEVIFDGLVRRGSTSAPHWREAFEQSNGLTLEFTHLLSQGQRLSDVIRGQVGRRIEEGRLEEVDVLSLVAVADRWAARLSSADVAAACGASSLELRQATTRLADEHLLVERDGVMSGLHRLRSTAISAAIHEHPPPDLNATIGRVLGLVPADEIHRFVANALAEEPTASDVIVETAGSEHLKLERLVAYLHGLRLADFLEIAKEWKEIAEAHAVPTSSQPVLFNFAAAGLTFPDVFPAEIRAACAEMETVSTPSRAGRLAKKIGYESLARILASVETLQVAAQLLASLDTEGGQLTIAARKVLTADSSVVKVLAASSTEEIGECLAAARSCDRELAELLIDLVGGQSVILERLRAENPWITALDVREADTGSGESSDEMVGFCRLLHVSDELQGDPRERAIKVGRTMLRCLPTIESVDVQALLPGGHELRVGDYTHGVSGLRRQYDHTSLSVSWNQARLRAAVTLLGEADTERLANALPLLEEAVRITSVAGSALVLGRTASIDFAELARSVTELHTRACSLKPPLGAVELGDTPIGEEAAVPMGDDLSSVLTDLTGNILVRLSNRETYPALEAYMAETVIGRHLAGAMGAPWDLLGVRGHPECLDRLSEVLADLHAVVREMTIDDADLAKVGRSARSGSQERALSRAAATCRRSERRRQHERQKILHRSCRATGLRTNVLSSEPSSSPNAAAEWAVTVELDSLLRWPDAVSSLTATLSPEQPLRESYVFIPLREGRPVPSLAIKQISNPLPVSEIDNWAPQLAEAHPSLLADAFAGTQAALQMLSGIAELPESQRDHPTIEAAASQASEDFERARNDILAASSDSFTQDLVSIVDELAADVLSQFEGTSNGGTGIAEQVAAALVEGADSAVFDTIVGAGYFALEWDIDAAHAVDLYLSA